MLLTLGNGVDLEDSRRANDARSQGLKAIKGRLDIIAGGVAYHLGRAVGERRGDDEPVRHGL